MKNVKMEMCVKSTAADLGREGKRKKERKKISGGDEGRGTRYLYHVMLCVSAHMECGLEKGKYE